MASCVFSSRIFDTRVFLLELQCEIAVVRVKSFNLGLKLSNVSKNIDHVSVRGIGGSRHQRGSSTTALDVSVI